MESKDNKLYGVYNNESELQEQIHELKTQGFSDEDMYVVANHDDQISMVRGSTEIESNTDDGNWWSKFKSFLLGEDTVNDGINRMGFDDREREHFQSEVRNGKILLYVDREYGASFARQNDSASHMSNENTLNEHNDGFQEERIELHQDRVNVDKTQVQSGEGNVNKHVKEKL